MDAKDVSAKIAFLVIYLEGILYQAAYLDLLFLIGLLQQRITCSSTHPQNSSTITRKPHILHSYFKSFWAFAGVFFLGVALTAFFAAIGFADFFAFVIFLAAAFAGLFAVAFLVVFVAVFFAGIYDLLITEILYSSKHIFIIILIQSQDLIYSIIFIVYCP